MLSQLQLTKLVFKCAEFLVFLHSVLSFFPSLPPSLSPSPSVFLIALFFFLLFPLHLDFFPCYFLISLISGTNHSSLPLQILYQRFLIQKTALAKVYYSGRPTFASPMSDSSRSDPSLHLTSCLTTYSNDMFVL